MLLELLDVWYAYPGMEDPVLRGVTLRIPRGAIIGIVGENGSGKTTLLNIMAGLLPPARGTVVFMGKPLSKQLPTARRHIGLLFQNPEFMLFNPRVRDEVAYTPRQVFNDERIVSNKILEAIDKVGLPRSILDRQTHSLSYGEKKLVALASILSYEPLLLLLDEPFSSLSENRSSQLKKIILEHKNNGGSVVITSHDLYEANVFCDRIFVLENGVLGKVST